MTKPPDTIRESCGDRRMVTMNMNSMPTRRRRRRIMHQRNTTTSNSKVHLLGICIAALFAVAVGALDTKFPPSSTDLRRSASRSNREPRNNKPPPSPQPPINTVKQIGGGDDSDDPASDDALCACQPGTYVFNLDFGLSCADSNVKETEGVLDTACILTTIGQENVTDRVPVTVSALSILELDQNSQVVYQRSLTDQNLVNGDSFDYTSITIASPEEIDEEEKLPKGLQVFLSAKNSVGEDIVNFFAIEYDNEFCSDAPILSAGQQIGWTTIGEVGDANHLFCPAVTAPPTTPVTAKPTVKPTAPKTSPPTTKAPVATTAPVTTVPETPAPTPKKPETSAPTPCVPVLKGMGGDQAYGGGNAGYYETNSKRGYYGYSSSSGSEKSRSSKMGGPKKASHSKSSKHGSKSSKKITKHSRKVSKGKGSKGSKDIKGGDGYYGKMYRVENDGDGRLLKVGPPSPTVPPTLCPEDYIPQVSDPNKVPDERRYYLKRRTEPGPRKPDEW